MKKLIKKKYISIFIVTLIILFIPIYDIIYYSDYYINNQNYQKINGIVFSKKNQTIHIKATAHRTYNEFRYIVNGKVYYHKSHMWSSSKELKINDQEIIYYNINNPNKAYSKFELNNKYRNLKYIIVCFSITPLFLIIILLPSIIKKFIHLK